MQENNGSIRQGKKAAIINNDEIGTMSANEETDNPTTLLTPTICILSPERFQ